MIYQTVLEHQTKGRGTIEITQELNVEIKHSHCETGLCNLFIQHTSASLILCENADPQVRKDLETFMQRFIPDGDSMFRHNAEGPDDMPAHIRTILTTTSINIPIVHNQLALGTWQGVYLWEHRTSSFRRKVVVTVMG